MKKESEFEFDFMGAISFLASEAQGFMITGVIEKKLKGSELHCFVETRISEKIGKMILEGLGHQAFCS